MRVWPAARGPPARWICGVPGRQCACLRRRGVPASRPGLATSACPPLCCPRLGSRPGRASCSASSCWTRGSPALLRAPSTCQRCTPIPAFDSTLFEPRRLLIWRLRGSWERLLEWPRNPWCQRDLYPSLKQSLYTRAHTTCLRATIFLAANCRLPLPWSKQSDGTVHSKHVPWFVARLPYHVCQKDECQKCRYVHLLSTLGPGLLKMTEIPPHVA